MTRSVWLVSPAQEAHSCLHSRALGKARRGWLRRSKWGPHWLTQEEESLIMAPEGEGSCVLRYSSTQLGLRPLCFPSFFFPPCLFAAFVKLSSQFVEPLTLFFFFFPLNFAFFWTRSLSRWRPPVRHCRPSVCGEVSRGPPLLVWRVAGRNFMTQCNAWPCTLHAGSSVVTVTLDVL